MEEIADLQDNALLACLYFAITFYLMIFTIVVAGMYIGRMLEGLFIAREKGRQLQQLKYKNELSLIGLEISEKKKKLEKERNMVITK